MTFRGWYLGVAAALVAFLPPNANAVSLPNLLNGGGPADIAASPLDSMFGKFNGVTTETSAIATGSDGGSCTTPSSCGETTWGVGLLNNVFDTSKASQQTWQDKDPLSPASAQTSVAFVLYGVADKSVTTSSTLTTVTETVANVGATTSVFGTTDGKIHLDLYYMSSANRPCFTAGCGANEIDASARTANTVSGVAQVTGITDKTLFASFTLQKGTTSDSDVTLSQSVTFQLSSGTTTGSGNQATFYAICDAGPGCTQFNNVTEDSFAAGSFFGSLITDIFGNIGVASAPGASINTGFNPGCTGVGVNSCANTAGWLFNTNDPIDFVAAVPEPASLSLLGAGLTLFGFTARRRRKRGV